MILRKEKDKYISNSGMMVAPLQEYKDMIKDAEDTPKPTKKELIELGKQAHPYYSKDLTIENAQNTIDEIEEFEKTLIKKEK